MFSSSSEIWSFFLSPYLNILYVKKKKKKTHQSFPDLMKIQIAIQKHLSHD